MYQRTIFINPPVTRQWVDIKVFAVPATLDDRSALAAMIAHVRYRDSYDPPRRVRRLCYVSASSV
ncbi:hypothetical protein NCCNTM_53930 [Mycolicibacterium sp. NCC-Tsukiji]|nr:hypothetical protein NCCNTM_53930 [Mycolicibacterium sp. NCC-Tsukiji]